MPSSRLDTGRLRLEFGQVSKWVLIGSLIGVLTGFAAVGFEYLLHLVAEHALRGPAGLEGDGLESYERGVLWVLLVPAAGGLLAGGLCWWLAPEAEGHGTDAVIRAFHRAGGVIRKRVIAVKAVASALTIGTGGSAGQEGPVAQVGAGVGSMIGEFLKLPARDRRLFVLAGATAGVGAMFTAPLGGALLMAEVPYRKSDFEGDALIPCIISSIVAYATFTTVTGKTRAIELPPEVLAGLELGNPAELLVYALLGMLCALVGFLYVKIFYGVTDAFQRVKRVPPPLRAAFGGFLVGSIGLMLVPLAPGHGVHFGGYSLIQGATTGTLDVAIPVLFLLAFAKIVATSFCIGSGGSGGLFAPSLAVGALLGAAVGQGASELFPGLDLNPAAFALVGMGGFFAGVAKVPVTSVIIVSEMTGEYSLLAPLMLVGVVHLLLSRDWTIYSEQVGGLVDSPAHAGDYVVDVLQEIPVGDLLEASPRPALIHQNATLREALTLVQTAAQSYFPVVDDDEKLVGIFTLSDVRRIFRMNIVEDLVIVRDFMVDKVATVLPSDNLNEAMTKLNQYHIHAIPVVDPDDPRELVGMLNRHELGRAYDRRIKALRGEA